MVSIDKITQKTENKFVNLYDLDVTHKNGAKSHYYVASRAKNESELKIVTGENHPDGVILPDADPQMYPEDTLSRHRLYTAVSRAIRRLSILAEGNLTGLLEKKAE